MIADYFAAAFPAMVRTATFLGARDPESVAAEAVAKSLVKEREGKTIERSYLYQVLRNLIVDDARRAMIAPMVRLSPDLAKILATPGAGVASTVVDALDRERILAGLTPGQAAVVRLRAEGYEHAEIGALLGCTAETTKARQRRAWRAARKIA